MKMPPTRSKSLRALLGSPGDCAGRFLWGIRSEVSLSALLTGSWLGGHRPALADRCVLLSTHDQLATAVALIELDGLARRMIVCPPGIGDDHLQTIVEATGVDAVVSDSGIPTPGTAAVRAHVACDATIRACVDVPVSERQTEWILLTSGTSGKPKMVRHDLLSLTAAIKSREAKLNEIVWGTFYDIRRYGGLQIFLRAILGTGSLILSSVDETPVEYLARLAARGATHVSGTPSH